MIRQYSPRTVILAAEALANSRAGRLRTVLERYFPPEIPLHCGDGAGKDTIAADGLVQLKNLARQGLVDANWGQKFVEDVVEERQRQNQDERDERFLQSLRADGFEVKDGKVVPLLSLQASPAKEESVLEQKLDELDWKTALGHLREGITSYEASIWAGANGCFRTFLEAVFDEIASTLYPTEARSRELGGDRRKLLKEREFLSEEESELVKALFLYLHTEGPHPGLSDEFISRMRRYFVEVTAIYFVEKYEKAR